MTCDRIRPLLSNYHDDALSPRERARVRDHMETCASCRAALEGYDRLYATLRRAPVAVPADLRRNIYAGIAELDSGSRSALLPFGPGMWGMLRATGGTAGLLAVLGGLVFAAMHAASGSTPSMPIASAKGITAAETAASGLVAAMGVAPARRLPTEMRTAIASLHSDLAGAEPLSMTIGRGTANKNDGGVDVPVSLIRRGASGAPRAVLRGRVVVALHSLTPVVSGVDVGSPSPAPTIAPGDGLAYLHLDNSNALTGHGNSTAEVAFHPFASGAPRAILVTPVAGQQLFTGLTVGADGGSIAYSARGQNGLGGVFGVDLKTLRHAPLFSLRDPSPPDAMYGHVFVKQVYATHSGPLFLTVVNQGSANSTVTINITGSQGLTMTGVVTAPLHGQSWGYWYDYVVAPDRHAVAWTEQPTYPDGIGALKVVPLNTTHPATITIGPGAHPVWSPDGTKILYERDKPAGLYVWSAATGSRRVVSLTSIAQPSLDEFTWAPNSRYFAYVTSTASTSMARLGDADAPGYTWPAFADNWIGAIAWAHAPATATASAAGASPTPPAMTSAAGASPALPTSVQAPTPVPMAAHPLFDNTDTPANVLHSFYNAINRREYRRAFAYLYNMPGDAPNLARFTGGYDSTLEDTVSLTPAPYRIGANVNATTCVGFDLVARQTNGAVKHFGGWYVVRSTSGRNPTDEGWRIIMTASHIREGAAASVPLQARCIARGHTSK